VQVVHLHLQNLAMKGNVHDIFVKKDFAPEIDAIFAFRDNFGGVGAAIRGLRI
jgi:hypothetical protein